MRASRRRPWRRLAALRAGRRRQGELPAIGEGDLPDPMPPLECPDDDREFVSVWMPRELDGEPAG
jgi:hypothetical protein